MVEEMKITTLFENDTARSIRQGLGKWWRIWRTEEGIFCTTKDGSIVWISDVDRNVPHDDVWDLIWTIFEKQNIGAEVYDTIEDNHEELRQHLHPIKNWALIEAYIKSNLQIRESTLNEIFEELIEWAYTFMED